MADSTQKSRQKLIEQCLTDIDPSTLDAHNQKCWICHQVMQPAKNNQDTTGESQKLGSDVPTADSPRETIPDTATDEGTQSTPGDQEIADDRSAVRVECGHTFCRYCISKWLSLAETCPECRHRLFTAPTTITKLDLWQEDRFNIIYHTTFILEHESHSAKLGAQRLRDFVMRETSEDEVPSRLVWAW